MSDAYAGLAAMIRDGQGDGRPSMGGWLFGTVITAGHGNLQVSCNGLSLGPEDVHLPSGLNYTWESDPGGVQFLRAGDRLLILVTSDQQDYYVLQKAVWQ